ncbi:MAG: hypothetical protein HYY43_00555 [Deltaproteobacteria bacterium]|nr:hypothetical protein [Deltaproteobacteria bacterium]MBI2341974.1 hypothetical protein [Deltaproteobacteria bacterium]MBI2974078.1 hypothetical protein [Deltaproteobacteria bacterium]
MAITNRIEKNKPAAHNPLKAEAKKARAVEGDKEAKRREELLISMKEQAILLKHLQEKDLLAKTDALEAKAILNDLEKYIKELEEPNV